jgi:TIR domain
MGTPVAPPILQNDPPMGECPRCHNITNIPSNCKYRTLYVSIGHDAGKQFGGTPFFCQLCGVKLALVRYQGQFTLQEWQEEKAGIFVSYCHQDDKWCLPFIEKLRQQGQDVWCDSGIKRGADFIKAIEEEIQARPIFLALLSPNAFNSEWVMQEGRLAIALHKTIYPILFEPTQLRGFWITMQYVDATRITQEQAVEEVMKILSPST